MSSTTTIEWTDRTWNPIVGCSLVSPGCTNCYAMRVAARVERCGTAPHYAGLTQASKAGPVWTGKIAGAPNRVMMEPMRWRKPARVFVNSMSDLFHEHVPFDTIDKVFAVMALAPQHTFQVLTKRPERMREYMYRLSGDWQSILSEAFPPGTFRMSAHEITARIGNTSPEHRALYGASVPAWPLPNVWLGVSVEDQRRADERVPLLLDTPAAVRWVSAEPLLGPVDLIRTMDRAGYDPVWSIRQCGLDWVVVGGESGPDARPMHPQWARSLRDQCAAAGVPFLFKQWGEFSPDDPAAIHTAMRRVGKRAAGRKLDGVIHDAFPEIAR